MMAAAGGSWLAQRRPAALRIMGIVAVAASLGGCATKQDIKLLRAEMVGMQARQDSLFRVMQQQNRMLLDTVRSSFNLQQNVRGDLGHQIGQLNQNLARLEALVGQQAQQSSDLRGLFDEYLRNAPRTGAAGGGGAGGAAVSAADAREYYDLGMQKVGEGSFASARIAFEALLREHPQDPMAADAQFQLAETYHLEGNRDRAITEHEKVPQQWPSSPRAPQALFRAGVLAQEGGNNNRARDFFNRVVGRYPQSDEARQAQTRLRTIR
jgi:tol-pal system protein YbgF